MLSKESLQGALEQEFVADRPTPSNDAGVAGVPTAQQLEELRRTFAEAERALEAIPGAAFVVDRTGAIVQTNAAGRLAIARDRAEVVSSLARALRPGHVSAEWSVKPLAPAGGGPYLAMLRSEMRGAGAASPFYVARLRWGLTARQAQVLELVARGLTNALVAETLGISEGTVEYHLTALFDKAGVCNRATLIVSLLELVRR
jgi:DNA-binding CsgD family transcriptional regulator